MAGIIVFHCRLLHYKYFISPSSVDPLVVTCTDKHKIICVVLIYLNFYINELLSIGLDYIIIILSLYRK